MDRNQTRRKLFGAEADTGGLEIVSARGSFVRDSRRRRLIDFSSGWNVGNFGWGASEMASALKSFKGPTYVSPSNLYGAWIELAEILASIAPGKLTKCFRATGGTEAVDLALQAAMLHTRRSKFISLEGSYHGNSLATLSIGDSEQRKKLPNLLQHCAKLRPPLDEKALQRVKVQLRRRDVAAFIMEPVPINLGVLIPSKPFMSGLAKECKRYGTLLIMDEVACGFGRTGKLFATEHFNIEPDILCLAKAITGGYAPMGATMMTAGVGRSMEREGSFYSTYGWHPLSVHMAIANLRLLIKHRKALLDHVTEMAAYFRQRLSEMKFKSSPAVRIQGLAIAVELPSSKAAEKVHEDCLKSGLLLPGAEEEIMLILPALNIDRKTVKKGLDILEQCMSRSLR
jgi:acetylornithine/succinyldiaminopimelate/putrescine aminotransferase